MPLIVVGAPLSLSRSHRQNGLSAIERLDRTVLVGAEHQCPFGRIEIQADNVAYLLHQLWVGRELECLGPVRLQAKGTRQMRLIVGRLRPVAAAIERVLHCVASRGVDSSVLTITAST